MSIYNLIEQLKRHEGRSDKPYLDTVGKLTIAYGRNLDDTRLSDDEMELMLTNDIKKAKAQCWDAWLWFPTLSEVRQGVLINMVFNMGIGGVKGFPKMLAAIERKDFKEAAEQMLDSKWSKQVGGRAIELATLMEHGD